MGCFDSLPLTRRLTSAPIKKVAHEPMRKYQVYATLENFHTLTVTASPQNIPVNAPVAFARRSMVPSKNNPSRLPSGNDVTVRPVSSNDPQRTKPKAISTRPHASVILRDNARNFFGF